MCCSNQAQDIIREKVAEFVQEERLFTAYDISKAVQAELKSQGLPFERHRDLKGDIHQEVSVALATGDYVQTLHDVGAPTRAFLYLPQGADPNDYVPQDRKDTPKQADTDASQTQAQVVAGTAAKPFASQDDDADDADDAATPANGLNGTDDDDDEGDEVDSGRLPDARGTVCVPNHVLRSAGFSHRDVVYVVCDNGKAKLVKQLGTNDQKLATYTVDYSDNVRITSATLQVAGIGLGQAPNGYDFKREGDKVVVSVH
jgi:hypothetical protein